MHGLNHIAGIFYFNEVTIRLKLGKDVQAVKKVQPDDFKE